MGDCIVYSIPQYHFLGSSVTRGRDHSWAGVAERKKKTLKPRPEFREKLLKRDRVIFSEGYHVEFTLLPGTEVIKLLVTEIEKHSSLSSEVILFFAI